MLSLTRECLTDYKIPGSKTVIPKGTRVLIPLLGLQRDPKYFSNPEKFDPDRFSDDRKDSITPYTYMPFGEGRRACIGKYIYSHMVYILGLKFLIMKKK